MIKRFFLGILLAAGTIVQAQDSTKLKIFDYSKLKPVVHFFANAEYNPSGGVLKDYSFWIGRTMFGFNYQFDKHWSTRVLIDRTRLSGSSNSMYVKVANLRWTPNDRFSMEGGAVSQNNFTAFEALWGYRFVAETFQDRYYGIPSSDLGIIAFCKISPKLSLDVELTNGEGPRIDQDDFGNIKLAGGLSFNPSNRILTRVFYHLKSPGEQSPVAREQLFNAFVGYQAGGNTRFGAELIYMSGNQNIQGVETYGGTVFGCMTLVKSLSFLVRYDRLLVKSSSGIQGINLFSQNALITGFSLSPVKGITLCLNYQGAYYLDSDKAASHRILFSFEYKI